MEKLYPSLAKGPDQALNQLLESAQAVTLAQNSFVFRSGDLCENFVLLLDGSIRVQLVSAAGREITLYRIVSGGSCVLTTSCLLSNEHYPAEAVAETDIVALAVPRTMFQEAFENSKLFRDFVFGGFSARLTDVIHRIEQLALNSVEARLVAALLNLEKSGQIRVTHQKLAVELGTAREVVSRHLKVLESRGIVSLGRNQVTDVTRLLLQIRA